MATSTTHAPSASAPNHSTSSQETTTWLRTFIDRTGARATLRSFRHPDFKELVGMYYHFEPKQIAQRLPPRTEEQIHRWLTSLTHDGENFVVSVGRHIVGHCVLCNLMDGRAELAIFVHQSFQNRGIGSQLIQLVKRAARAAGYQKLWISVESSNLQAIRFFMKNGFQFTGSFDNESEMVLDLALPGRPNTK